MCDVSLQLLCLHSFCFSGFHHMMKKDVYTFLNKTAMSLHGLYQTTAMLDVM